MKKINKLQLNKETIASLSKSEQNSIIGGDYPTSQMARCIESVCMYVTCIGCAPTVTCSPTVTATVTCNCG